MMVEFASGSKNLKDFRLRKRWIRLAKSLCATADGMFLLSVMIENYDLKTQLTNYFLEIEKLSKIN